MIRETQAKSTADVRYRVDPDQSVSEAVVLAVETASDREAVARDGDDALAPLYHAVDPDALDALFATGSSVPERVSFVYAGHEVTVEHGEVVTVAGQ